MASILTAIILFLTFHFTHCIDLSNSLYDYNIIHPKLRFLPSQNAYNPLHVSFDAYNRSFSLILRAQDRPPAVGSGFRLLDGSGIDRKYEYIATVRYYDGYLSDDTNSHAFVSLDNDDQILGHIDVEDETYYFEPLSNFTDKYVIYRASDVRHTENGAHPSFLIPNCPAKKSILEEFRKKRAAKPKVVKRNRCTMKLVADYEFYKVIGNSNYYRAARYLIDVIARVNRIFSGVDWGINGAGERLKNLGFLVTEMKIFDRPTPQGNYFHFNNEKPSTVSDRAFQISNLYTSFSEDEGSNKSCVSVLVTAKVVADGILGLAAIGSVDPPNGACAMNPHNEYYVNTAVVTVMKKEGLMITRIFDLVIAHELGHLWGSHHDDNECTSDDVKSRFIMHENANTGYDKNNYQFSNCSILSIHKVLYGVQPDCFVEEKPSLCGNGIVEPDEECDAGGNWSEDGQEDPCCTLQCKWKGNARCSPKHSECCSQQCDFLPADRLCQPRNNDTCQAASFCNGNSSFCPLPGSVEDGTVCQDEGTCSNGVCKPFCEQINKNFKPCICEKLNESCYRCCKDGEDGVCMPYENAEGRYKYVPEGSICIVGHCHKNVCEKEKTDITWHYWNILRTFNQNPKSKIFGDYIVFVVIVVVSILWIPVSCLVNKVDENRKQEEEQLSKQEQRVEHVGGRVKLPSRRGQVAPAAPT